MIAHRRTRWLLVVALGLLTSWAFDAARARAEAYQIDAVHSSVLFRVKHMNTSNAWGRFNDIQGSVDLDGSSPAVDVQLKTDSIDTGNAKREEHLKSPDFFNVKQFPAIGFKSAKIKKLADNAYELEGTLNLHGVERPLTVRLEQTGAGKSLQGKSIAGYETTFTIKRSDFGMKYLVGPIGDEVLLIVSLECATK